MLRLLRTRMSFRSPGEVSASVGSSVSEASFSVQASTLTSFFFVSAGDNATADKPAHLENGHASDAVTQHTSHRSAILILELIAVIISRACLFTSP